MITSQITDLVHPGGHSLALLGDGGVKGLTWHTMRSGEGGDTRRCMQLPDPKGNTHCPASGAGSRLVPPSAAPRPPVLRWRPAVGDVLRLLDRAAGSRQTAATRMNAASSRSHMVLQARAGCSPRRAAAVMTAACLLLQPGTAVRECAHAWERQGT